MQMSRLKPKKVLWDTFPETLTIPQVEMIFRWSRYEIMSLIKSGRISAYRITETSNGHWRIRTASLKRHIDGDYKEGQANDEQQCNH